MELTLRPFIRASDEVGLAAALLGGRQTLGMAPATPLDLVELSRRPVKASAFDRFAGWLRMSERALAEALDISFTTLHRRGATRRLAPRESEKLVRTARVLARAILAFGDEEAARGWLGDESPALGGKKPVDLLDTSTGAELLVTELGRIEYGVYA